MPTITLGGTTQSVLGTIPSRRGFVIQNQSAGSLWIRFAATATADANSLEIRPGATCTSDAGDPGIGSALSIIGATTGQAFYVREW